MKALVKHLQCRRTVVSLVALAVLGWLGHEGHEVAEAIAAVAIGLSAANAFQSSKQQRSNTPESDSETK